MEKYRDPYKDYCPNVFIKNLESKYFNYLEKQPAFCGKILKDDNGKETYYCDKAETEHCSMGVDACADYDVDADKCTEDCCITDFVLEDTLCKQPATYFPVKKNDQKHDNIKYYVRPLECKLKETYFKKLESFGSEEIFWENCVDLDVDSKPQIRVHGRSAFNITNFAQFENIEFTGEDNFLKIDEDEEYLQDVIDAAPFKFCEYQTEATGYLEEADI